MAVAVNAEQLSGFPNHVCVCISSNPCILSQQPTAHHGRTSVHRHRSICPNILAGRAKMARAIGILDMLCGRCHAHTALAAAPPTQCRRDSRWVDALLTHCPPFCFFLPLFPFLFSQALKVFDTNLFEQLCINDANEKKLQQVTHGDGRF